LLKIPGLHIEIYSSKLVLLMVFGGTQCVPSVLPQSIFFR
jgi:hypothetical protein